MKRGQPPHGYTIIETMIFLIITGALLVSAITVFSGRLGRTAFTQSTREFETRIGVAINDVATGFYPNDGSFDCNNNNSYAGPRLTKPAVPTPAREQGSNTECIFLGKVMQFGVKNASSCPNASGPECSTITVYTLVGLRKIAAGTQVTSLAEAKPMPITVTVPKDTVFNPNDVDIKDTFKLGANMHITKIVNLSNGHRIGAIAFVSTLAQYGGSDLVSGSQKVQIIPIENTDLGQDAATLTTQIKDTTNSFNESFANPSGGVAICLQSGSSTQKAAIKLGTNNREIGTDVLIDTAQVTALC